MNHSRVLLADDDRMTLLALSRVLGTAFEVDCVESGEHAVLRVRAQRYDAIVTDIMMPVLDGLDFYHLAVTEDPSLAGRFIFTSGSLDVCFDPRWPSGAPMLLKPVSHLELIPLIKDRALVRHTTLPPRSPRAKAEGAG